MAALFVEIVCIAQSSWTVQYVHKRIHSYAEAVIIAESSACSAIESIYNIPRQMAETDTFNRQDLGITQWLLFNKGGISRLNYFCKKNCIFRKALGKKNGWIVSKEGVHIGGRDYSSHQKKIS